MVTVDLGKGEKVKQDFVVLNRKEPILSLGRNFLIQFGMWNSILQSIESEEGRYERNL